MSSFFRRLFSSSASPADGLTQAKREALIDLLNFCMCADRKLLLDEEITIGDELQVFSWDPSVDIWKFTAASRERAISAVMTPETRQAALDSISLRLGSAEAKSTALALCEKVFHADGEFAHAEQVVFQEIRQAFGLGD